jgi:hypothetical protein
VDKETVVVVKRGWGWREEKTEEKLPQPATFDWLHQHQENPHQCLLNMIRLILLESIDIYLTNYCN